MSLKLSDTRVYEPQILARLGITSPVRHGVSCLRQDLLERICFVQLIPVHPQVPLAPRYPQVPPPGKLECMHIRKWFV